MTTNRFALVMGIIFAVIGVAGFIPALLTPPDEFGATFFPQFHGRLFGLFPVNVIHNLVHLGFGLWGMAASHSFTASRSYARVVAVSYAVLAILGLFPVANNMLAAVVPIHGHDVWLHFVIAAAAAYFGWGQPARAQRV